MAFEAVVIKIFIASPDDVNSEKRIIRDEINNWNSIYSESHGIIYIPISWDMNAAPQSINSPQDYIDEVLLDKSDVLLGIFGSKLGNPTKGYKGATVYEIKRHIASGKNAMIYFSKKDIPREKDKMIDAISVLDFKKEISEENRVLYAEFESDDMLRSSVNRHLSIMTERGVFRCRYDSDNIALIKDDGELADAIGLHFPTVAYNLVKIIIDEPHSNIVWEAIISKLRKSPAELRDTLIYLAHKGAFRHFLFQNGYKALSDIPDQSFFGQFMSDLYSINKYEFKEILDLGIFKDCQFKTILLNQIRDIEDKSTRRRIIV